MSKKGKILVLVAPSGGGKTTMARRILDDFDQIRFSVSATTRPPRKGEKDGVNYH
ncbi:MAG: guanylate kinase, partial [Balneolaceae bacterium]|nr:guanylate kinase [Balneolaceae bacterium]